MTKIKTGYSQALEQITQNITSLSEKTLSLQECAGHTAAEDIIACANAPSSDTSLKDGYALQASDITDAGPANPARLPLMGSIAAGQDVIKDVQPGCALRILTGGKIPSGADTVVAEEFVNVFDDHINVTIPTRKGKNILDKGSDTKAGQLLVKEGTRLTPGIIGYLASGGCCDIRVYQKPSVAIIAAGDEILLPGQPLPPGKVYASNMLTLDAWCRGFGMKTTLDICKDNQKNLEQSLVSAARENDAVITCGGSWSGDKDLVAGTLSDLGWKKSFHRLRLGPGKGAGFGFLNGKPVFVLPGGPPSNLIAFLMLALPGLLKLCGIKNPGLPQVPANLSSSVSSRPDWTHAEFGRLENTDTGIWFHPIGKAESRLKSMADAQALLLIPEGVSQIAADERVMVYDLSIRFM